MQIHCIIIDDEPLARNGIKEYIHDIEFLELVGEFDNPLVATELLGTGKVQLIFLDIQMPKITGLDFLKTISEPPAVIFITAYPEYAIEGFEVNAVDYLVKPVSFERFLKAAMKAKDLLSQKEIKQGSPDHFFIKVDNSLVKLQYDDVLFVEALQNYVTIHTATKKYISYLTFRSVEVYLPAGRFVKVHKSFIVSADKVNSIDGNEICIGQHRIPISRSMKDEVMEKLTKGKFLKR